MDRNTWVANLSWIAFGLLYQLGVCWAVKCLKDDVIGDQPGNVYHCDDPSKTECCQQDSQFTCCELASIKTLREQMILWGSVIVVLLTVILLVVCFKLDISYCSSDKTLKDKFVSFFERKKKQDPLNKAYAINTDGGRIRSRPGTSNHHTDQPTPEEIKDFHNHTTSWDTKSSYDQSGDLPLTARGVGVELGAHNNWNS